MPSEFRLILSQDRSVRLTLCLPEVLYMIDGGPSVLFDAVAIIASPEGIDDLLQEATTRDFVADAFQHCKVIGHDATALPLLEKAGIAAMADEGVMALSGPQSVTDFVARLGKLRVWGREQEVKLGKAAPPKPGKRT